MQWIGLKFYIILFRSFVIFQKTSTLRQCCSGTEGNILDSSPELIFADVLVIISSNSSSHILNDTLTSIFLGDLSNHQTALTKVEGHAQRLSIARSKYSSLVVYGLNLNGKDVKQINEFKVKETEMGSMKSTFILLSYSVPHNISQEIMSFVKNFDISNKCHIIHSNLENSSEDLWSSIEAYQDIRGNVRLSKIPVKPYALTVPGLSVPFNLNNLTIRATAVDSIEEATVIRYRANGDFGVSLGALGLWDLRDTLNFSVVAMKAEESLGPQAFVEGKVVGIARQLLESEADISILHSYHTIETIKHLKPLSALGEDTIYAIFRQPPSLSIHNVFIKPFHRSVWVMLFCVWVIVFLLLLAFLQIAFRHRRLLMDPSLLHWEPSLALLWSVCALCQRSFFCLPEPNSLRFILMYGGSLYLIVYLIYSAEIISYLTADSPAISTMDDLLANHFEIISDPNMFYSYFTKDNSISQEDLRKKLAKSYKSEAESLRKVAQEGHSFHLNTLDTLALIANELNYSDKDVCKWYSHVPIGSVKIKSGFFIKRHSALQEPFNRGLIGIMERGLNHRYIKSYYELTLIKCPKAQKTYREDLGISDVITAFGILAVGIVLASTCLIFERCRLSDHFSCT